jgi:hypothetical protein
MLIFSPDTIYKPAFYKTGGSTDPCLLPESQLEVGYTPNECNLPDGVQVGVTYLKAFMSNEYVDLSYLEKSFSPFDKGSGEKLGEKLLTSQTSQSDEPKPFRLRGGRSRDVPTPPLWGTLLVPIVIERVPGS